MKQKLRFRRTTIISAGLLAFLSGLVAANRYAWHVDLLGILLLAPVLIFARKRNIVSLSAVFAFGLACGVARGSVVGSQVAEYETYRNRTVHVSGQVLDDPVYDDGQLDFRIGSVTVGNKDLPGQIRVKAHVNGVRRGDKISVSGTLREGFGNYQGALYFTDVKVLSASANPVEKIRREFFAAVYNVLPEPNASLGLGFLVGLRSALPEELDDQLRIAGLTHIVVASGYNLTVLVRLCRRLLAKYSKYQAFAGSIGLILGFLMVTGASPSMVRASVVTILSLLAWYYGRRFQPVLIILLGAALTAGYNPLFIWYDLGWWLSFLAFSGVLIIAPLITARLWRDKQPPMLAQVAIETTSAQIMATPLILFVFGEVSLVALLANILVVPFIPLAMAGTFVAGLANVVLPGVWGAIIGLPANTILTYIVSITRLFASPSWAQQSLSIVAASMAAFYAVVLLLVLVLHKKSRIRFHELPSAVE